MQEVMLPMPPAHDLDSIIYPVHPSIPLVMPMVQLKEPRISGFNRKISVDGFSNYANPSRVRFSFYSIHMGFPEKEKGEDVLQLVRETELDFDREVFLNFADRVAQIKDWLLKHPLKDKKHMSHQDVADYIASHFTSDEILAIWAGREITIPENVPLGLIPLFGDDG